MDPGPFGIFAIRPWLAGPAFHLAFSPDGRSLLTATLAQPGGQGYQVDFWDAHTGRKLREPIQTGITVSMYPVFSPDGRTMALHDANWKAVEFWEVATWQRRLDL